MKLILLLAACLATASVVHAYDADAMERGVAPAGGAAADQQVSVLQMSPRNIKVETNGSHTMLVAFLARPAPAFEAELVKLNDMLGAHAGLKMGAANCAKHPSFMKDFGLSIFPAIRIFPAGTRSTPFTLDFSGDLDAAAMLQVLQTYAHAASGMPSPLYDDSMAAARAYLAGPTRGQQKLRKRALELAKTARTSLEMTEDGSLRKLSGKLDTPEDVDYERSRFYEFLLEQVKFAGVGFVANELNRIRGLLFHSPRFVSPDARAALLVKLHVLLQFEGLLEFQDLNVEIDDDFKPTGWKASDPQEGGDEHTGHGIEL